MRGQRRQRAEQQVHADEDHGDGGVAADIAQPVAAATAEQRKRSLEQQHDRERREQERNPRAGRRQLDVSGLSRARMPQKLCKADHADAPPLYKTNIRSL
ncbi:hypothetical protein [Bradyrhizobium elkanii]|uniref:hypothetical protein n=1 Tax=Bradyrhizobium elkanii TaxID=29448 RepID=UPI003834487A